MPASPDVQNYHIGKGIVSFQGGRRLDLHRPRQRPSFVYTPAVEKKEHFSSREGVKTKDFTAITQVGATIKFTLDEITATNLAFFALGDVDTTVPTAPSPSTVFPRPSLPASIKVVGTNDIGQKVDFIATVSFVPTGDFSFITDEDDFSVIRDRGRSAEG